MIHLSFQNHILEDAISVFIHRRVLSKQICRHLSLHNSGFQCRSPYIVQLIPTLQILLYQFPVKEDNGNFFFLRHINNRNRLCPVYQINTDHVTALGNHIFHLTVLGSLALSCIIDFDLNGQIRICLFHGSGSILVKLIHQP